MININEIDSGNFKNLFKVQKRTGQLLVIKPREGHQFEFKESFNWLSKAKYGKSIAAFANRAGGLLVFGIKDKPRQLLGLSGNAFESLDEAKITEYLNSLFSPEINFKKFSASISGKSIGVLAVFPTKNKPVLAIKTDDEIKEAEIYYRYSARSEKIKFPEFRGLIEELKDKEKQAWMSLFERIGKIGSANAAVLDTLNGQIDGIAGTLILDKKLIPKLNFIKEGSLEKKGRPVLKLIGDVKPVNVVASDGGTEILEVRYTDSPNAPAVNIIEESALKNYKLTYAGLVAALKKRFSNFKADAKFHDFRNKLIKSRFYCITRLLNPSNPKSAKQNFYNPSILKEFDKIYKRR